LWDMAKGLSIFMVLFLHVRCYSSAFGKNVFLENFCWHSCIYIFFVASGYFSVRLLTDLSVKKLCLRLTAYLYPVLSILVAGDIIYSVLTSGAIHTPANGWIRNILKVGWFFFALAFCETATFACVYASKQFRFKKALVVLLCTLMFFGLWILPVGLCHALVVIPFYWFGCAVLPRFLTWKPHRAIGLLAFVVYVLVCALSGDSNVNGLNPHADVPRLYEIDAHGLFVFISRYVVGLMGTLGILTVCNELLLRFKSLARLSVVGMHTGEIFFLHIYVLSLYYSLCGWTGGGVFGRFIVALSVLAVCLGLARLSSAHPIVQAILWNPAKLATRRHRRRS
jgi:hypothetical protein